MKILIPIPSYGFDPTEVSIPWQILKSHSHTIVFATPNGMMGAADKIMLTGTNLGIWKGMLKARKDAVLAYFEMCASDEFKTPHSYNQIRESDFDALLLPGGHDKGVIEYLESDKLQSVVRYFFKNNKPVAAICHGVVLVAKTLDFATNKSVIHSYHVTCLLKSQELLAYRLTKNKLKDYYLTYPNLTVEDEVRSVLDSDTLFSKGPLPLFRDSIQKPNRGFCVKDKNLITARWPGDAYRFSLKFLDMLNGKN